MGRNISTTCNPYKIHDESLSSTNCRLLSILMKPTITEDDEIEAQDIIALDSTNINEIIDKREHTLFTFAISRGHIKIAEIMLSSGMVCFCWGYNYFAFVYAIGNVHAINLLRSIEEAQPSFHSLYECLRNGDVSVHALHYDLYDLFKATVKLNCVDFDISRACKHILSRVLEKFDEFPYDGMEIVREILAKTKISLPISVFSDFVGNPKVNDPEVLKSIVRKTDPLYVDRGNNETILIRAVAFNCHELIPVIFEREVAYYSIDLECEKDVTALSLAISKYVRACVLGSEVSDLLEYSYKLLALSKTLSENDIEIVNAFQLQEYVKLSILSDESIDLFRSIHELLIRGAKLSENDIEIVNEACLDELSYYARVAYIADLLVSKEYSYWSEMKKDFGFIAEYGWFDVSGFLRDRVTALIKKQKIPDQNQEEIYEKLTEFLSKDNIAPKHKLEEICNDGSIDSEVNEGPLCKIPRIDDEEIELAGSSEYDDYNL